MDEKLPYYMAYPMPLLYDDERQNQRDYEYMKSVYPGTAKRLMPYIEEECDRLEYMGSVMYDEYPDRLQLLLLCRRIYNRAKADETKKDEAKEMPVFTKESLLNSKKYMFQKDLLNILLKDGKEYTLDEVDKKINEFKTGIIKE